jgi:8-oxo-dGTP diphosphatase
MLLRGAQHQLRPAALAATTKRMAAAAATASLPTQAAPPAKPLVLVVAAAILRRRRPTTADADVPPPQVLLAQRPAGKALAGLWEFPGGKVDDSDASPEHALARELDEELGLKGVDPRRLVPLTFASHSYEKFHLLMPLYAFELEEGEEPKGMEGQAITWSTGEELRSGKWPMPPADDPLVEPVCSALAALGRRRP